VRALLNYQSYINATLGTLTEATWGWDVAWRRFLSVSIGITAAWIFAYRKHHRVSWAHDSPAIILFTSSHTTHVFQIHHLCRRHFLRHFVRCQQSSQSHA
jgi:hypothetical protein